MISPNGDRLKNRLIQAYKTMSKRANTRSNKILLQEEKLNQALVSTSLMSRKEIQHRLILGPKR